MNRLVSFADIDKYIRNGSTVIPVENENEVVKAFFVELMKENISCNLVCEVDGCVDKIQVGTGLDTVLFPKCQFIIIVDEVINSAKWQKWREAVERQEHAPAFLWTLLLPLGSNVWINVFTNMKENVNLAMLGIVNQEKVVAMTPQQLSITARICRDLPMMELFRYTKQNSESKRNNQLPSIIIKSLGDVLVNKELLDAISSDYISETLYNMHYFASCVNSEEPGYVKPDILDTDDTTIPTLSSLAKRYGDIAPFVSTGNISSCFYDYYDVEEDEMFSSIKRFFTLSCEVKDLQLTKGIKLLVESYRKSPNESLVELEQKAAADYMLAKLDGIPGHDVAAFLSCHGPHAPDFVKVSRSAPVPEVWNVISSKSNHRLHITIDNYSLVLVPRKLVGQMRSGAALFALVTAEKKLDSDDQSSFRLPVFLLLFDMLVNGNFEEFKWAVSILYYFSTGFTIVSLDTQKAVHEESIANSRFFISELFAALFPITPEIKTMQGVAFQLLHVLLMIIFTGYTPDLEHLSEEDSHNTHYFLSVCTKKLAREKHQFATPPNKEYAENSKNNSFVQICRNVGAAFGKKFIKTPEDAIAILYKYAHHGPNHHKNAQHPSRHFFESVVRSKIIINEKTRDSPLQGGGAICCFLAAVDYHHFSIPVDTADFYFADLKDQIDGVCNGHGINIPLMGVANRDGYYDFRMSGNFFFAPHLVLNAAVPQLTQISQSIMTAATDNPMQDLDTLLNVEDVYMKDFYVNDFKKFKFSDERI